MIDVNTEDKNITSEEAYNYIFKHENFIGTFYNDGVNVTTIGAGLALNSLLGSELDMLLKELKYEKSETDAVKKAEYNAIVARINSCDFPLAKNLTEDDYTNNHSISEADFKAKVWNGENINLFNEYYNTAKNLITEPYWSDLSKNLKLLCFFFEI